MRHTTSAKALTEKTKELFRLKLEGSGIPISESRRLGLEPVSELDMLLSQWPAAPGLLIKYFDLQGHPTPFFRVRLLADPVGFPLEKPLRYLQPPDTGVAAYFPTTTEWSTICVDASAELYVTEGELKACCASLRGFPTIGLGGVYSWRSAKRGISFLPELEIFDWRERAVVLVFDSDASNKHQVMQALHHLASELTLRGAIPRIAKLPTLPDQDKTGLDDFLVARGSDAFEEIITLALPYKPAEALWLMNRDVCFVRDPGLVYEFKTGSRMSVQSFVKEVYANTHHDEQQINGRGETKTIKKDTAAEWIKWEHRLQVHRITYRPGAEQLSDGELNTWRGSNVIPIAGDVEPWHQLVNHLFGDDLEARRWFERWCAYPFAFPGSKLLTAVVLWGIHQGTGKSLLGYTLGRLYGEHNVSEINQDHLRSHYNDWLVDKQLVLGEEITGSDRRADADRIKALITQKILRVSSKYVREYTVPALANFFFTSNHPDAFFLEDTDRRFFVHEVVTRPLADAFYKRYTTWFRSAAGASALLYYFQHLDLGDFNPDAPAMNTRSKREMIEDNKSDLAGWVLQLKRDPQAVLRVAAMPADAALVTTTQLKTLYDPTDSKKVTVNGLGRELKRSLVPRLDPINVPGMNAMRFYVIQDIDRWLAAPPGEAAQEWLRCFGKR